MSLLGRSRLFGSSYLIISIALSAMILIFAGFWFGNVLLLILGSVLMSASGTGIFLKIFGFDIYLRSVLQEMIVSRDYLRSLNQRELEELIKRCLVELGKGQPIHEIYDAIERQILDKIGGIVQKNRVYTIDLDLSRKYGENLVRAKITASSVFINSSSESKSLFKSDTVSQGIVSPVMSRIPKDMEEVFSFKELRIDDRKVNPEVTVDQVDSADPTKGVKYVARYRHQIAPAEETYVSYATESILNSKDYILRRFTNFTSGGVEIIVNHPPSIGVSVIWFARELILQRSMESATTFLQRGDGVLFPGDGFVVFLSPRRE